MFEEDEKLSDEWIYKLGHKLSEESRKAALKTIESLPDDVQKEIMKIRAKRIALENYTRSFTPQHDFDHLVGLYKYLSAEDQIKYMLEFKSMFSDEQMDRLNAIHKNKK